MARLQSINPKNGLVIRQFETMSESTVRDVVAASAEAWADWRQWSFEKRAACFNRLAGHLRDRRNEFAMLMTNEMGKPISQGRSEVDKCAMVCEWFAQEAATLLADRPLPGDGHDRFLTFQPLGVVYAIMPWNLPFWQVFRAAAPTMMAGNGLVLKHAPNVMGCAEAIEELFAASGFPEHLFGSLCIDLDLSPAVIAMDAICGVSLTGSGRAGRAVAAQAGAALKKSVLELGGSDPYIMLEDADLDAAVEACLASRMLNNGQVCVAAKRLIAVASIHDAFVDRFVDAMRTRHMEDPESESCQLGPLAREDLRDAHHQQVTKSLERGATCLLGGDVPDRDGWWYPATVLVDVRPGQPAFDEELFGPTAAIIRARDEDDAIALANDSPFGLGGGIFTRDLARGAALARDHLNVGCCAVNDFVRSDPAVPFGGIRQSGFGRELGPLGILEFVNIKAVSVA